jgi:glycosyltransferase involved in cell wall biosynthesis
MADLISVIVSTYNREDALAAVLRSLARQGDRDFEVLVADDGSGTATARVVADWASRMPVPLKHVWHPDRGFRLAEIRNRAIRASAGVYGVFIDGDCIARSDFVAAHRRLAEPGWFVTGNRILLSHELTERILRVGLEPEQWRLAEWLAARAQRRVNRFAPLLDLPLGKLRRLHSRQWRGARGSNIAFWRADLDKVDGFDAAYSGWGREDSDIFIRMIRAGVLRKDGRFATGVLHLWHAEADRARLADNERMLAEVIDGTRVRAKQGLSRVIEETAASIAHA